MNEHKWEKPRNCVPTKCFFKPNENTEEQRNNDDKFIALADKDAIEEKEEDKTKKKFDELKMKKI